MTTSKPRAADVEATASVRRSVPRPRRDRTSWSAKFADSPTVTLHHSETTHAKPTDRWPSKP